MQRTFQPSRHSYVDYGDSGQVTHYRGSPIYRFYEKEAATALFRALGIDASQRLSKKDGVYRNWDIILLAQDKDNPKFARLLAWTTGPDISDKVSNKLPWKTVDSVKSTASWEKEEADYDLAQAHYNLRFDVGGRSNVSGEPSPANTDAGEDGDKGGGSSFPWLPVIGGSVLVLGLGVGGYLYYKSRKSV
jgi:hypothetical protein